MFKLFFKNWKFNSWSYIFISFIINNCKKTLKMKKEIEEKKEEIEEKIEEEIEDSSEPQIPKSE